MNPSLVANVGPKSVEECFGLIYCYSSVWWNEMPLFVYFITAIIPKRTCFYGGYKSDALGALK